MFKSKQPEQKLKDIAPSPNLEYLGQPADEFLKKIWKVLEKESSESSIDMKKFGDWLGLGGIKSDFDKLLEQETDPAKTELYRAHLVEVLTLVFNSGLMKKFRSKDVAQAEFAHLKKAENQQLSRIIMPNKKAFFRYCLDLMKSLSEDEKLANDSDRINMDMVEIDLKNFRDVNAHPTLGRAYGDMVASVAARVLQTACRQSTTKYLQSNPALTGKIEMMTARTGGDEYMVMITAPLGHLDSLKEILKEEISKISAKVEVNYNGNHKGLGVKYSEEENSVHHLDSPITRPVEDWAKLWDKLLQLDLSFSLREMRTLIDSGKDGKLRGDTERVKTLLQQLQPYLDRIKNIENQFSEETSDTVFAENMQSFLHQNPVVRQIFQVFFEAETKMQTGQHEAKYPLTRKIMQTFLPLSFSGLLGTIVGHATIAEAMVLRNEATHLASLSCNIKPWNHSGQNNGETGLKASLASWLIFMFDPETFKNLAVSPDKNSNQGILENYHHFLQNGSIIDLIPENMRPFLGFVKDGPDIRMFFDNKYFSEQEKLGLVDQKLKINILQAIKRATDIRGGLMVEKIGNEYISYSFDIGSSLFVNKSKNENGELRESIAKAEQNRIENLCKLIHDMTPADFQAFRKIVEAEELNNWLSRFRDELENKSTKPPSRLEILALNFQNWNNRAPYLAISILRWLDVQQSLQVSQNTRRDDYDIRTKEMQDFFIKIVRTRLPDSDLDSI
jgi:GGDEF domain-containing protein